MRCDERQRRFDLVALQMADQMPAHRPEIAAAFFQSSCGRLSPRSNAPSSGESSRFQLTRSWSRPRASLHARGRPVRRHAATIRSSTRVRLSTSALSDLVITHVRKIAITDNLRQPRATSMPDIQAFRAFRYDLGDRRGAFRPRRAAVRHHQPRTAGTQLEAKSPYNVVQHRSGPRRTGRRRQSKPLHLEAPPFCAIGYRLAS